MSYVKQLRKEIRELKKELELQKLIAEQAKDYMSGGKVKHWEK